MLLSFILPSMGMLAEFVRAVRLGCDITRNLEALLAERVARAHAAWPTIYLSDDRFVRAIAVRLAPDEPVEISLLALRTDDLYLACGCAAGLPDALAAFEACCGAVIERAIVAAGAATADRADLGQVVRQRLLVAPTGDDPPRIASYSARGTLIGWVRVVASREALRMMACARRETSTDDDELALLVAPDDDPETNYLKQLYRDEFKRAFQTAIAALDDRDRLVLRQHALDGLSIDQLAIVHDVHRATAARWIDAARKAVLASVQRELLGRLRLSHTELARVIRMIQSRLDVSLPRILH